MQREPYAVAGDIHIQDAVAGRWDWEDAEAFCDGNPHTISFSEDRTAMHIVFDKSWTDAEGEDHKEAIYDLQEMTPSHTDWVTGALTKEVHRCPEPATSDSTVIDAAPLDSKAGS